jgi:hypothetical protein
MPTIQFEVSVAAGRGRDFVFEQVGAVGVSFAKVKVAPAEGLGL